MIFLRFCVLVSPIFGYYFNFDDRIDADCVPEKYLKTYKYLGNRNKTLSGENCASWSSVDSVKFEKYHHSKCRNLPRNSENVGPWCYSEDTLEPQKCFETCEKFESSFNIDETLKSLFDSYHLDDRDEKMNKSIAPELFPYRVGVIGLMAATVITSMFWIYYSVEKRKDKAKESEENDVE